MPLAFVTGATGFVGLNLIEALGRDGWDVVALHRSSSDVSELLHRGVERREGDITDLDAVRSAMPERSRISPNRMNSGMAVSIHEAVLR